MGIFNFFKKKDDIGDMIKDPLGSPLGDMPQNPPSQMPDMPGAPDMGMPQPDSQNALPTDDAALGGGTSAIDMGNPETSASMLPRFEDTPPEDRYGSHEGFASPKPPLQTEQAQTPSSADAPDRRDMELITSKLDGIKAQLDAINTRLEHLERKSNEEEAPRPRRYAW